MKQILLFLIFLCASSMASEPFTQICATSTISASTNTFSVTFDELLGNSAKEIREMYKADKEGTKQIRRFTSSILLNRLNSKDGKVKVTVDKKGKLLVIENNTKHSNDNLKKQLIQKSQGFFVRLLELKKSGMDTQAMLDQLKIEFSK